MATSVIRGRSAAVTLAIGFVAGALAVLIFHQMTVWFLSTVGMSDGRPYSVQAVQPFGIPQFLNAAFWGGLWGCLFALLADRFPRSWPLWLAGLLFGMIFPTLVGWFIVGPIKGRPSPFAQGLSPRLLNGPIINGMWGLGTALFYDLLRHRFVGRARWM